MRTKYILIILLGLILLPLSHPAAWAGDATLSWVPPTTNMDGTPLTDLAGFKVYYGTHSDRYTEVLDVGMTSTPSDPEYTISDLADGHTYYFAVAAYDASGVESNLSDEASKSFGTSSIGDGGSSIGGGCGMIKNISGGSGQNSGRVVLNLLVPVLLLMIQKLYYQARKKFMFQGIMMPHVRSKMYKGRVINFAIILTGMMLLLVSGQAFAANYPLEIIQPQAGLNTKNRFYKAYPGIEYNVKVAVIGGAYPFTYSLTAAPSGMTINSSTGVISWPNPTTTGSPYSVAARVTDQEGTTANVPWTITVTTSGFLFVDGANGTKSSCNGGSNSAGTISQPFKTIADWYCGTGQNESSVPSSKHDTTYANYFIYYRTGTYTNNAYHQTNSRSMIILGNLEKPVVHMAYPGETVTWNMGPATTLSGGGLSCEVNCTNFYMDRINFNPITNAGSFGVLVETGDNVTIRRCTFNNLPATSGSNNQSSFFTGGLTVKHYYSITENAWTDIHHAYATLLYFADRILVADNTFDNFSDPLGEGGTHVIAAKSGNTMVFFRNNKFTNISGDSLDGLYSQAEGRQSGDWEFSYNLVMNTSGLTLSVNQGNYGVSGGPVYVFRNTLIGAGTTATSFYFLTGSNGPYYAYNNIIQDSTTSPADHVLCGSCSVAVIKTNTHGCPATCNLAATSGLVDTSGNLVNSAYIGIYGYQTKTSINLNAPAAPQGLGVR